MLAFAAAAFRGSTVNSQAEELDTRSQDLRSHAIANSVAAAAVRYNLGQVAAFYRSSVTYATMLATALWSWTPASTAATSGAEDSNARSGVTSVGVASVEASDQATGVQTNCVEQHGNTRSSA